MSLDLLFSDDDKIFVANIGEFGTFDTFLGNLDEVSAQLAKKPRNFFCINPMNNIQKIKENVSKYQNFLFECDKVPLDKQIEKLPMLKNLGIIRTATFSGNKSIHFVVSCSDDLDLGKPGSLEAELEYKAIWKGLCVHFQNAGLPIDTSNNQPAVLSRLPGMYRGKVQQELWHTGKLVSSALLKSMAAKTATVYKSTNTISVQSYEELEARMANNPPLEDKFKRPDWISPGAGNYPNILQYTLWAIDSAGATPETFFPYLEKHFEQHLINKNYFKDWRKSVFDAFRKKGML